MVETELETPESPVGDTLDFEAEVSSEDLVDESPPVEPVFEVDGEPITVDEARNGYLRQSDYTRKTQELSEQRRRLQNAEILQTALQRDPEATVKALADAYGVSFGQAQSMAKEMSADTDSDLWGAVEEPDSRPSEPVRDPRLDDLVKWREQQEVAAAQAQIQRELSELSTNYGEFDEAEVLRFTLENGFPDVTSGFKAMHFDRLQNQVRQRQEEAKRVEAKREAQTVSPSGSKASVGSTAPTGGMTIRDAWLAARKEHGF